MKSCSVIIRNELSRTNYRVFAISQHEIWGYFFKFGNFERERHEWKQEIEELWCVELLRAFAMCHNHEIYYILSPEDLLSHLSVSPVQYIFPIHTF